MAIDKKNKDRHITNNQADNSREIKNEKINRLDESDSLSPSSESSGILYFYFIRKLISLIYLIYSSLII